jgi:hypothetical protein
MEAPLNFQFSQTKVNVSLILPLPGMENTRELIRGVCVETDEDGSIKLEALVDKIKKIGYPINGMLLSYYSPAQDLYMFAGNDGHDNDITIPVEDYQKTS